VKRALLRLASELQLKLGRRVDLNDAIRYLLSNRIRRPELLEKACRPLTGFEEAYRGPYIPAVSSFMSPIPSTLTVIR